MKKLISEFSVQLKQALDLNPCASWRRSSGRIEHVLICGMGSAATAGEMVSEAISAELQVPVLVKRDYLLPHFAGERSLLIFSSYSGDTEETVKAMEEALAKHAQIVVLTSGGKLMDLALKVGANLIQMNPGMEARTSVAHQFVHLLHVLCFYGIISPRYKNDVKEAARLVDAEEDHIRRDAKEAAAMLFEKLPVIYTSAAMESVALRIRQQLNENAKVLCWHQVFPEFTHSELMGWRQKNENLAVIFLRNDDDFYRTAKGMAISSEIISHYDVQIREVFSKGNSSIEKMLYFVHWGDWVSCFLAGLKGTDAREARVFGYVNSELAKIIGD